jgi:ribose transport system permease protein
MTLGENTMDAAGGAAAIPHRRSRAGDVGRLLRRYGMLVAFALILAVFTAINPGTFLTADNLAVIVNNSQHLGIVAVGLTVCLIVGEFDLSIGYVGSLIGMLTIGFFVNEGYALPLALLFGLGAAVGIGLVNGLVVTRLGVASLITTLSIGSVATGLTFLYGKGKAITAGLPTSLTSLNDPVFANLRGVVLVWLAIAAAVWFLLSMTDFGRRAYAVGASEQAARMSGVNVERTKVAAFVICSLLAGVTGLMLAASTASATPQAADGLLLDAYAAVFLGSVTLREGQFNIAGTVIAVLLLSTITNGLSQAGVDFSYATIVKGVLLVAAVALARMDRRRRRV